MGDELKFKDLDEWNAYYNANKTGLDNTAKNRAAEFTGTFVYTNKTGLDNTAKNRAAEFIGTFVYYINEAISKQTITEFTGNIKRGIEEYARNVPCISNKNAVV